MYKLDTDKTYALVLVKLGEGKDPNPSLTPRQRTPKQYVEVLSDPGSWCIKKSKENIARYDQDWSWLPKHNIYGKFDVMYINNSYNKHDEWS